MVFQQSPGINISEIDLTTVVPGVATSIAALAGVFRWGPVNTRVLVDSEPTFERWFGKPTNFNAETWFTGASFLSYSNAMEVSRAANTTGSSPIVTANVVAGNASVIVASTAALTNGMILVSDSLGAISLGSTITVTNATHFSLSSASQAVSSQSLSTLQFINPESAFNAIVNSASVANLSINNITSVDNFNAKSEDADFDTDVHYIAKWPGDLGNSLKVSQVFTANAFETSYDLTSNGTWNSSLNFTVDSSNAVLSFGANTDGDSIDVNTFNSFASSVVSGLVVGDYITAGNTQIGEQNIKLTSIGSFAGITLGANSATTLAVTSGSANLVTTAGAFSGLTNGQFLAFYSNTTVYRVVKVLNTVSTNTITLSAAPTVTNATSSWATLSSTTANVALSLEDRFKRASNSTLTTLTRRWEYADAFDTAPGQSTFVYEGGNTAAIDEVHTVVIDEDGKFSGVPGTVLEKFSALSRVSGSKQEDGTDNYYKDIINNTSQYIWAVNDISGAATTTDPLLIASSTRETPFTSSFALGADGQDESTLSIGTITNAYDVFDSADTSDISFILTGKTRGGSAGGQLANYLIDNIAEPRMDAIVFVSPPRNTVVNNMGYEAASIIEFRNTLRSTSYAFLDSGYKYMYDKYNDVFRYIPLNGDIAGLAARTENTNDAWWSFAGLNRGKIKNVVRLAWNPKKAFRDALYKNGINPVVTLPGDGTLLYGDKTLLAKPSAFDRINVRRLFIVLEKAIAKAAKYTLFEFNDPFTRAQFRNLVIPFLRDIQGRRGINGFEVICDNSNNPGSVVDRNEFNADILIQANRSINFIQLNFYNVPNGVAFSEVIRSQVS